jgi:hypothetical protein
VSFIYVIVEFNSTVWMRFQRTFTKVKVCLGYQFESLTPGVSYQGYLISNESTSNTKWLNDWAILCAFECALKLPFEVHCLWILDDMVLGRKSQLYILPLWQLEPVWVIRARLNRGLTPCGWVGSASAFFLQIFIYRACGTNQIKIAALSSRFWWIFAQMDEKRSNWMKFWR